MEAKEMKWYVVYVHSGCEKAVKQRLEEKIKKAGVEDSFAEILIPSQEVQEIKAGKKQMVEKKIFPGYVLINMAMSNETWHMVRDIPLVSGFLGQKMKPTPVSEADAANLIRRLESKEESFAIGVSFDVGQTVRVTEGPFASFNGVIGTVDDKRQKIKVSVSIFGRPTEVELSYNQVEKV